MLECLIPAGEVVSPEALLNRLCAGTAARPFDEPAMAFIGELSRALLTDSEWRPYPEFMALAHWFRPGELRNLAKVFARASEAAGTVASPRGFVFHLAPANVDSVFVYSWLLSLLAGNANLVRVSQRRGPAMERFCGLVNQLLANARFGMLAKRNAVVSYGHDDSITAVFSARCQFRIIWGGDDTVRKIRSIPLAPLAGELAFANRFSLAVFSASAVVACDDPALTSLAHGFCNDAFLFDQRACSSPRAVVWIGDRETAAVARQSFWPKVESYLAMHPTLAPDPAEKAIDRLVSIHLFAAAHPDAWLCCPLAVRPARLEVATITEDDRDLHEGGGLFLEVGLSTLNELPHMLTPRDQTLTIFGFEPAEFVELLPLMPPRAADRIVPIGQALHFDPVWDGNDILQCLTRHVRVGSFTDLNRHQSK
jgi:hypothetical protein